MDSFEMNKILGAVLGTCLVLVALNIAAGAVFTPGKLLKPGYEIAVPEQTWPTLVQEATFERMRDRADQVIPPPPGLVEDSAAFFRRG